MKIKKCFALLISAFMMLSLVACQNTPTEGNDMTSGDLSSSAPAGDGTTAPQHSDTTAQTPGTSDEPQQTTQTPETTTSPEPATIEVKWNCGYVGSSTNGQGYVNKIKPNGGSYSYTDVISISKAGTKIYFTDDNTNSNGDTGFASAAAYVISSWKMENGEWVLDTSGANYPGAGSSENEVSKKAADGKGMIYTYVTSKDNENIRLCFRSGQSTSFTPASYPTVYVEFTGEQGTVSMSNQEKVEFDKYIADASASVKYPELKGLTVNFLGDSYFAGNGLNPNYVWPALMGQIYGMNYKNYGKNGSTISDYVTTNNPMVVRYKDMANNTPNIVVLEGGKNDYNKNVPIGENTDTDTKTFKGALNVIIDGLRAKYPNAVLICVTPWKVSGTNGIGNTVSSYADAMVEICALKKVPCFKASDPALSGVDMTSASFRAEYSMSATDVSHLNLKGHKLVLPKFEKFIAEAYAAAKAQ